MLKSVSIFSLCFFLMLNACENPLTEVNQLSSKFETAVETIKNVRLLYSDAGKVKVELTAPVLYRYKTAEPYIEFPDGLSVTFFNDSLKVSSTLSADYGVKYEQKQETLLRTNVIWNNAVKNEKSQNVENQPYAMAFVEEIGKALYPDKHPYSWPVIGYVVDLNRATVQDAKNFFLRWYGPNNAILTVAGDFNPTECLAMIDKYFGSIKPCPEVKKMRVPPVIIPPDRYTAYKDRTYFPIN